MIDVVHLVGGGVGGGGRGCVVSTMHTYDYYMNLHAPFDRRYYIAITRDPENT